MKFQKNGDVFDVSWHYDMVKSAGTGANVVKTTCTISKVDNTKTGKDRFVSVAVASVVQDPGDNFCKSDGRRKSLTKILKMSSWNKEDRKVVWANYFAQSDFHIVSEVDFEKNFGEIAHSIGV